MKEELSIVETFLEKEDELKILFIATEGDSTSNMMEATLKDIEGITEFKVYKINGQESLKEVQGLGVEMAPALLIYKNKQLKKKLFGYYSLTRLKLELEQIIE